jgi:hypothetical protein
MSKMFRTTGVAALLVSVLFLVPDARASEPASSDLALPTTPGQSVVIEWTGTALPGASGAASECVSGGAPDDAHTINLTVPEGAYNTVSVTADFHVEWQEGAPDPSGSFTDPDLVLSVLQDGTAVGSSDGGSPQENVGLRDPAAGTYTAVVCPFLASQPTAYTGRLTLTAIETQACVTSNTGANPHAALTGAGFVFRDTQSGLTNFDKFRAETGAAAKTVAGDFAGRRQSALVDSTLGVPTFLWARTDAPAAAVGALNTRELLIAHARAHLRNEAKVLHLTGALIDQADAYDAQFNGSGPAIVRFRQRVEGVEVFHRSLNVLLDREYRPVAVSGYFATDFDRTASRAFARSGAQAIAAAWGNLGGQLSAGALVPSRTQGQWQWYARPLVSGTHWFEREPRAKAVLYPRNGALEPAYYVELFAKARVNGNLSAYGLVVSANDGAILHRENLKADAGGFTYRAFADADTQQPFDMPFGNGYAPYPKDPRERMARGGVPSNLVTLENAGIRTGDPWLADDATQTTGNHVDACIDQYDQGVDTPAGGLAVPPPVNSCLEGVEPRAQTTAANTFDYAVAADEDPSHENAKNAAVVNLFYMNNWLHDWWYNHGFDEVSGNAQTTNYGRTGTETDTLTGEEYEIGADDPVLAQGQDASGRNNANMATPADGSSPVMQQYLFDGPLLGEVKQTAPAAGQPLVWETIANGSSTDYDVEQALVLVDDGMGVSPSDACGEAYPYPEEVAAQGLPLPLAPVALPPQASLQGKIALVDRGNCNTTYKVQYALASGAVGVIVVNNVAGDPPSNIGNLDIPLAPAQPTEQAYKQMPTVIIRKDDGDALKAQVAAGQTVTVHMTRQPSVDVDGTMDNQIIAHEYFHYVHHRLTDSSSQQSGAMSEGWGDIDAFMLTVRADDTLVPGNGTWGGSYGLAGYVTNNFFAGIRRAPYTTDFTRNAYTFKHIADGEPTPDGGAGAGNSEVHAAGEIWANMVFECYAGILKNNSDNAFVDAQVRMQDYIIGGLKMTPADATYTEARDAILAVAYASDFTDYTNCSGGFARRGNGLNAVAPARGSSDLTGVVEDFTPFVCKKSGGGNGNGGGGGIDPNGSGGAGALGWLFLAPLLGAVALRRRRRTLI